MRVSRSTIVVVIMGAVAVLGAVWAIMSARQNMEIGAARVDGVIGTAPAPRPAVSGAAPRTTATATPR